MNEVKGFKIQALNQGEGSAESNIATCTNSNDEELIETEDQKELPLMTQILCMVSVFFIMFLSALDQTIVVTIIPNLQRYFETSNINWIITGYSLPVSIFSLIWGRLSFLYGTKRVCLIAVVIFEIGSLVSAVSRNFVTLIIGRVIAGIGGSGISALSYLIINEISTLKYRSWFFNIINLAFAVSSALGPIIGGLFSEKVTWRWCFYINLPIGGVSFIILTLVYKPHDVSKREKDHQPISSRKREIYSLYNSLNLNGLILLSIGLSLFLLGLSFGGNQLEWKSALVITFLIIGFLFLVLFVVNEYLYKEANHHHPFIPFRILSNTILNALSFLLFSEVCFIMQCVYLSNYLQYIKRNNEFRSGIKLLPMIISVTITSTISSFIITKFQIIKPLGVLGGFTSPIASYLLSILSEKSHLYEQLTTQILSGVSFGLVIIPGMMLPQIEHSSHDDLNIVTSLSAFMRAVGASFGSIIGELVFCNYIQQRSNGLLLDEVLHQAQYGEEGSWIVKLVVQAYRVVLYVSIGFGGIEFVNSLLLHNGKVLDNSDSQQEEPNSFQAVESDI